MAKKNRWFIPTNSENLKMIIAQGLISSPNGFKKYYSDILELIRGYIPVFKNQIGQDILTYVVSEENDLIPTIIEIDLKKIVGNVKKIENNRLIEVELDKRESEDILFIQAPLPLSLISTIIFKSKKDKDTFEEDSKLYSNVILAELKLSSTIAEQKLFKSNMLSENLIDDFKKLELVDVEEVDYQNIYAYGGLLLNLFYFAKNGNLSNDRYKLFVDLKEDKKGQDIEVYDYFKAFDISNADIKRKMDYGLITIAINSKDFKEAVLEFLEYGNWDERVKKRTHELANKLKSFESNINKTVSEQFSEAKTPLEKILLMLFLREDSESLMEYTLDLFSEEDYLNFAMMFGIRDKFIKIPKELREFSGLQNFVSQKMAEYAHSSIESGITFKSYSKPLTLMDMFNKNSLKKRLIKEFKLEDSIQTIMPRKDYTHEKGKNIYRGLIEPGYRLLDDEYFKVMSKRKITNIEYNKYAKLK